MAESKKTLFHLFKTPEKWWNESKPYFLFSSGKDWKIISACFWATTVYRYLEHDTLAGRTKATVKKILAEMAFDFVSIKKRDDIWVKVYPQLAELFKNQGLVPIRTSETDWHSNKESQQSYGKKKEDTKTAPILGMTSAKVSGVDWGEISKTLLEGFYQDGKFNPNVENKTDSGTTRKTIDTKIQRQQQVGKIIQAVASTIEDDFSSYLVKYSEKYTWRWTYPLGGSADIDYSTGSLRFNVSTEDYEEDAEITEEKKKIARPDLEDISKEQWEAKRDAGEAVEISWDIECWRRARDRLLLIIKGKTAASQETANRQIKAYNKLMDIFSRNIYIPKLEHYDKVMDGITGFKFFKKELRDRMETARRYRRIGEKAPQVFYCLLGKPGVGKTEICKQLAKAMCRPFCLLSMGGATETKPLEGVDPSYKSSSWSDILETFVEKKSEQVVFLDETEAELKMYKGFKYKTEFQKEKITELEELIKKMKDNKVGEMKMDLGCKAPVILLDEGEKVKHPSVLDAMGKILDENVNWSHYDKFLEYRINLGECLVFVTMNWYERAPDFIRDRCKFVDIELLTYQQRIEILEGFANKYSRDLFPEIGSDGKVDRYRQKELVEGNKLSTNQQRIRDMVGKKTIETCITESWGIRGGIMNLKKVFDLLMLIDVRREEKPDYGASFTNLDNWDWDSDNQFDDDLKSDKVRRLRYTDLPISGARDNDELKYEELVLTKKSDRDFKAKKSDRNWAEILHPRNQIKDWGGLDEENKGRLYDPRTDDYYSPDGSGEYGTGEASQEERDLVKLQEELRLAKIENEKLKAKCQEEIEKLKGINEKGRQDLELALNKLEQAGENKEKLEQAKRELENKLANMGIEVEAMRNKEDVILLNLTTTRIRSIPVSTNQKIDGVVRFGGRVGEKNNRIVAIDEGEAPKLKKLIIIDMPDLVQLDLTGCINLEKLSFKNSKWDNVVGIKDCQKLKKVSVRDCPEPVLNFLEGTEVEELKIL